MMEMQSLRKTQLAKKCFLLILILNMIMPRWYSEEGQREYTLRSDRFSRKNKMSYQVIENW